MKKTFEKFCKEINFKISQNLVDSEINFASIVNNEMDIKTSFFSIPSKEELIDYIEKTKGFFKPLKTNFYFSLINKNYSNERILNLLDFGSTFLFNKYLNEFIDVSKTNYNIKDNSFAIEFESLTSLKNFNENINIDKIFNLFEINDLSIKIINKTTSLFDLKSKEIFDKNKQEFEKLLKQKKEQYKNKSTSYKNTLKKDKKYFKLSMIDFYLSQEQFILVEGKVFDIQKTTTKTNLIVVSVYVTDEKEAIVAKYFLREDEKDPFDWLQIGKCVSITGEKKQEYNLISYFLQIKSIDEIKKDKKVDNATKKRIEFSVRTSMSAMDGFINASDFMKYAKEIGHEAIAFADLNNIQSFPDIYNASKKISIKPIYGSTFSIIPRENQIIWNTKKSNNIKKEKYVIFDLETTSLNPRHGEIIEFGAVITDGGTILDTIQFFIKPSQPISKFTTELTGITQSMLNNQHKFNNQKDAIEYILKIFDNATLVAHNALFDIGFIKEKMKQNNLGNLKNQYIDTMGVAKYLFPISQSYRLEMVAKKLDIVYDPTVAHRANYDAKVLQQIWSKMINLLEEQNICTFDNLEAIDAKHINNKKRPFDLAIYAKNQDGLKELFKLISLSLTDNYFDGARIFENDLKQYKNIIAGPCSINSRLIDLMQTGTTDEIVNEINKWDFIGIPSPHLFSHLISRNVFTKNELHSWLKEIIHIAKKLNKLIIAIGDVRYLDDSDILAHSIYINTKGLEGRRHALYKYNEIDPDYPKQKYLTTDEMLNEFEFLNSSDLAYEIVVENTNKLNSFIDSNIEVIKSKLYPPNFDNSDKKLVDLVYENARDTYGSNLPTIVQNRIERELEPIKKYGFSVVYWISQKLVAKSMSDGYLVGSRGSVGSSIVATLCGITEVNPLSPHYICSKCKEIEFVENPKTTSGFDLPSKNCNKCNNSMSKNGQTIPFETFLGFNGDKVPDIDLNFSGDYQPIIHQEVRKLFGEKHTFRAGTISTVATKTAFGYVKKYFEEKHEDKSNHFASYLAQKIEGSKRTTGQHPGGIIIIPKEYDVEDFSPINFPANDTQNSWLTTHFDFHAIHDNVLKLDLLGHDDPTAIRHLQNLTNVKMSQISFSDEKVMKLFSSTEPLGIKPEDINNEPTGVLGIPEFGTKFVRKMLRIAKPNSFNDLINISGLSHGTDVWNGNAEELIKQGKTLNEVISCRDDIMVYLMKKGIDSSTSFQIMEKVRKGKGLSPEDEKLLKEKKIEKWYIDSLNKIKYMFPKAHATAYVMMAWRIAWFKIYFPLEYYATFFTVRSDVFDIDSALGSKDQVEKRLKELETKSKSNITSKEEDLIVIFEIINEMLARDITISNIDLYKSNSFEWKIDYEKKSLIPPFIVIDGLGEAAAHSIVEARKEKKFTSKQDILKRTQINKTVLEKMDKLGITKDLDESNQIKLF